MVDVPISRININFFVKEILLAFFRAIFWINFIFMFENIYFFFQPDFVCVCVCVCMCVCVYVCVCVCVWFPL